MRISYYFIDIQIFASILFLKAYLKKYCSRLIISLMPIYRYLVTNYLENKGTEIYKGCEVQYLNIRIQGN